MSWREVYIDEKAIANPGFCISRRERFVGYNPGWWARGNRDQQRSGPPAGPMDRPRGARKEIQVALNFEGRRVDVDIKTPQGIRLQAHGEVKVDESSSPRKLDWINFSSPDDQEFPQIPGIYKIDGDTFTVCTGGMNGSRPREFKPGDGVLSEVVVFQRERVASAEKTKPSGSTTR